MRVVVTGATSMIGVALIKECINNGDSVLAIVREGTGRMARLPKSDLIRLEYADLDTLNHVQGDGKEYDVFYHFAWAHTSKSERDDALLQEKNIKWCLDAVELANKLGCKKFIGAGSQAEYGRVDGVIDEDTVCNPLIAYGMGKLSAYYLSRKLCDKYDMTHVWGRIFSVYGTNDNSGTMIDYALSAFAKGEVARFSSGEQSWNYLFETDAGIIFHRLGASKEAEGIYCVANPESRKLKEYIFEMAEAAEKSEFVEFDSTVNALGLNVNMKRTENVIGNLEYVPFKKGIREVMTKKECC